MKRGSTNIELTTLDDGELDLVLKLLRAALNTERRNLRMEREIRKACPQVLMDVTDIEVRSWPRGGSDVLGQAQARWRIAVRGPNLVPDVKEYPDFDTAQLKGLNQYRIPTFVLELKNKFRSRKKFFPVPRVIVKTSEDLFDWFLVRAIVNRQLSRFAHCVVCDEWELKKIAGQRSQKKFNIIKGNGGAAWIMARKIDPHDPSRTVLKADDGKNWLRTVVRDMPMWPAICSRKECKSRFNSVFADKMRKRDGNPRPRALFKAENFKGLLASVMPSPAVNHNPLDGKKNYHKN